MPLRPSVPLPAFSELRLLLQTAADQHAILKGPKKGNGLQIVICVIRHGTQTRTHFQQRQSFLKVCVANVTVAGALHDRLRRPQTVGARDKVFIVTFTTIECKCCTEINRYLACITNDFLPWRLSRPSSHVPLSF